MIIANIRADAKNKKEERLEITKINKKCCKCNEPIMGFVAHKDQTGDWCEDCLNLYTCEDCGSIEDYILDGGLCAGCEADHGE